MIYGIGIDIVRIERIRSAADRWGERFLSRVFTGNETAECFSRADPFPSLAARFAAKEAMIKAVGSHSFSMTDVEVVRNETGKPSVNPKGPLRSFLASRSLACQLSLSHEHDYATAVVILESAA